MEQEEKAARTLVLEAQEKRAVCTCCFDADITAKWNSQLYEGGLEGYLQVLLPTSFKLVAINPLGQPLFAITSDGVAFQTINAVKGVYKHGRVSSFVERHSMPENILHDQWGNWLSGTLHFSEEELVELRRDAQSRGIWLTLEKPEHKFFPKEYLLFDPQQDQLLERIVVDTKGRESVRVSYRDWTRVNGCPLPTSMEVEGISYGTIIDIELEDIRNSRIFDRDAFNLKLPPGYLRQYYP